MHAREYCIITQNYQFIKNDFFFKLGLIIMYHKIIKFNYKYNAFCVEHVFYNKSNSFRDFFLCTIAFNVSY